MYGPFEVLERLGVGGMATVHRAIERGIDGFERVVALKRLLPHLAEDVDFVRAFVREARLASLLQHSNIVQLYELGRVGASYFISMEYIPGRDLRMVLRQARRVSGPPPVEIAIALLTELLDALDYAHSKTGSDGRALGLIHRDISPANLIVGHTGHLKVIDFGIAKATFGHLMTNSGKIKGKLSYMAPEVLAGRNLDGRSDLFSASIIAHELLTATPLFAAKDDFQIIDRLQNMDPPAPSVRNATCPHELDQIVLRGLAKDPSKRWRSAAEMRGALADLAMDQRLLATNRDVCQWVDEMFQQPVATTSSRRRLPLTAPPSPLGERRRSQGETDDEVMDIVWGMSSPRAAPVVLDEVPDVSGKIPLAAAPPPGPDPLALPGSDPLLMSQTGHTGSMSIPERSGEFNRLVAAGQGMRGPWTTSNFRQVTNPSGWAIGTGPTGQHGSQGMLEEAIDAARRAEAMALAAMASHRRRPLVPVLVAAMAVSLAGAVTAWIITSGDDSDKSAVTAAAPEQGATGQGATLPPAAAQQPAAPAAAAPSAAAPAGAAPPPVVQPVQPAAPAAAAPADSPADSIDESMDEMPEPAADRRARRTRAKRDATRGRGKDDRDLAADGEEGDAPPEKPAKADKANKVAAADLDEAEADEEPAARTAPATGAGAQPAPSAPVAAPKQPPASVAQPAAKPGPAATKPSRPSGPIVISSSRAQRLAGNAEPIRFPEGAELPRTITAKLCVDTSGTVTSVTVLSKVSASVRRSVERALSRWRYRPVEVSGQKVAACFATAFPVKVN